MIKVLAKALVVWFVLVTLAIGNGFARETFLATKMEELPADQLSCVALSVLILACAILFVPWFGVRSAPGLIGIGAFLTVLTVAFEFLFGRFVAKQSWSRLIDAYDLLGGRLWILVLLVTLLAPLTAARIRRL